MLTVLSFLLLLDGAPVQRRSVADTVPPFLHSYRLIVFRDGRVGVQVQGADRDSGIPAGGVVTDYSSDGGRRWETRVHSTVADDFGNAAIFEVILGPFARGTSLRLRLTAGDSSGNVATRIPTDGSAFVAPIGAERALGALGRTWVGGEPVLAPETIRRVAALAQGARDGLMRGGGGQRDGGFDARRARELATIPALLERHRVDVADFRRVPLRVSRYDGGDVVQVTVRASGRP